MGQHAPHPARAPGAVAGQSIDHVAEFAPRQDLLDDGGRHDQVAAATIAPGGAVGHRRPGTQRPRAGPVEADRVEPPSRPTPNRGAASSPTGGQGGRGPGPRPGDDLGLGHGHDGRGAADSDRPQRGRREARSMVPMCPIAARAPSTLAGRIEPRQRMTHELRWIVRGAVTKVRGCGPCPALCGAQGARGASVARVRPGPTPLLSPQALRSPPSPQALIGPQALD